MEVNWTEPALHDVAAIEAYVARFNPYAATDLVRALIEAADGLQSFPHRGRSAGMNRRELTVIWPYVIRYRIAPDAVYILRIRHGRQKPLLR